MKHCLVLSIAVLTVWAQKSQAFHDKAMEEHFAKCAEEQKLTKEDIEKLKKKENLTDEKYKCLAKCLGEKDGLIKDGKFNKDEAKVAAQKFYKDNPEHLKKAEEVIENCEQELKETQLTNCDIGPAVFGCMIKGAEEKKIMPKMEESQ